MALFISTLGMLMATIDGSITLISLPDIFRGIGIDPLQSGNSFFLLWMILGFLVVTSVLVTTLGRLGDIYGRVRTYNLGFAVFTFFSLLLTITWTHGRAAGIFLIVMRIFQGVGAAMLMANSAAILTDAFPQGQRGLAMGINQAAALSGTFIGLVLGGLLAPINWRLIFLVSVPIGLFGTVWGYIKLRELSARQPARIDWPGNITFALGLILVMVGITYGIEPYGHDTMGWTNPRVIGPLVTGVLLLIAFGIIETKVPQPMFRLQLFKIRAFTAGVFASFLAALSRGGLMFMLIIWLQGIWLPLHGYDFARTPLWAGIALLPLTAGFLVAAPFSGILSDRYGARPFATGGMIGTAVIFVLLELLPIDFPYLVFAILLFVAGLSMSSFGAPNRAGVMNSLPARAPRGGLGDEHHVSELRPGPLHRNLLQSDDRRAVLVAAGQPLPRVGGQRRVADGCRPRLPPAAGLHPVRGIPGRQPGPAPHRTSGPVPSDRGPAGQGDRPKLLPGADHRAVPGRAARGIRLRHRGQPAGRRRLLDPGWARPGGGADHR